MIDKEEDRTSRGEDGPAEQKGVGGVHGHDPGTVELITSVSAVHVTVAPKDREDAPRFVGTWAPVRILCSYIS